MTIVIHYYRTQEKNVVNNVMDVRQRTVGNVKCVWINQNMEETEN